MKPRYELRAVPFLIIALLVMGIAGALTVCTRAHAAAPMLRTTTPGWYRMMLGKVEVTALSDGTRAMPVEKLLKGSSPDRTRQTLTAAFLPLPYQMNFNAFLVNTGSKLILVDTGAGQLLGGRPGKLVEALEASGYRPSQVDEIYITHMHPDHIGGLAAHGARVFPNAVLRINRREADYWLSKENMGKAAPDQKALFKDAQAAVAPYIRAGRFSPFSGNIELSPGIRALALFGHTPGHTGYMVESGNRKMLIWGDVIHVPAVQLADPAISIDFDTNPVQARAMRERVLADAARNGWLIAGAHLPFPGLGHVVKDGPGYRWLPVSYTENH